MVEHEALQLSRQLSQYDLWTKSTEEVCAFWHSMYPELDTSLRLDAFRSKYMFDHASETMEVFVQKFLKEEITLQKMVDDYRFFMVLIGWTYEESTRP